MKLFQRKMIISKKVVIIGVAIVLFLAVGLVRQSKTRNTSPKPGVGFVKTFNETIERTDKEILEYTLVEVRFNVGKATEEEYINTVYLFEAQLTAIKNDNKLKNPPARYAGLVKEYEAGFDQILSAAKRTREHLAGIAGSSDEEILIKNKQDLEEGFKRIDEVKNKLGRLGTTTST